jgi:hypothetical protein
LKTNLENLSVVVVALLCLCMGIGCKWGYGTRAPPGFSDLPPEPAKLPPDEVPPGKWSGAIRALKPIKVYLDVSNLVVVQRLADGVESGKYIIEPVSSRNEPSWRVTKFTRVAVDGFSPLTQAYDYERSQP